MELATSPRTQKKGDTRDPQLLEPKPPPIDPFDQDFAIEIPEEVWRKGGSTERAHQEWMDGLRSIFLASPQGRQFTWIPQAVEAYFRSHQGVEGLIDRMRGFVILPRKGLVRLGEDIVLSFDELGSYSLEMRLDKLRNVPRDVSYSKEMATAVDQLSPGARYRWDLVAQAAQFQATQPDVHLVVHPTRYEPFVPAGGIGVFMADRPGGKTWSAVKVHGDELPFVPRELAWIDMVYELEARYDNTKSRKFFDVLSWLTRLVLKGTHSREMFYSHDDILPWQIIRKLRELHLWVISIYSPEHHKILIEKLQAVNEKIIQLEQRAYRLDRVSDHIYTVKGKYTKEHPFECTELTPELEEELHSASQILATIINDVFALLQQYSDQFMKILPDPNTLSDDPNMLGKKQLQQVQEVLIDNRKLWEYIPDFLRKREDLLEDKKS